MAPSSHRTLHANDPTYLWNAIFRFLAILLSIIGIAATAWALTHQIHPSSDNDNNNNNISNTSYYDDYDYYSDGDDYYGDNFYELPWTFISLGFSTIWNITNLAVLFSRNKAIHPGANVGCDLVIWLALIVTGTFAAFGASDYFYYDSYGSRGDPALRHKGIIIAVGVAMSFVVL